MAEFDLAKLMKDVSELDTGKQQIRYIPLDLIDPDPDNFYSLDGLEELAGSIEMLGLQQPLLLRPSGDGRFTVISGHRRRAALCLIRDGGSEQFADGVPCIVDSSQASPALQELKLIMANADTRRMTSADQNKQAERIEDLLRQLEDEGFEFPGRLRDWVSKLSGMSRTKLARLKMIRDNLDPKVKREFYDKGRLKEEAAYELAKLPADVQRATAAWFKANDKKPEHWWARTIEEYGEDLQRVAKYTCPSKFGGMSCFNQSRLVERIWKSNYRAYCHCSRGKGCCADCDDLAGCAYVCGNLLPKAEKLRKERRAENKKLREAEEQAKRPIVDRVRAIWLRFGNALSRANMEDDDLRKAVGHKLYQLDSTQIAALEAGEYALKVKASTMLPFHNSSYLSDIDRYIEVADALGCSLDYLLCRTDVPEINTGAATPESAQAFAFTEFWNRDPMKLPTERPVLLWNLTNDGEVYRAAIWDGTHFVDTKSNRKELTGLRYMRWMEIPASDAKKAEIPGTTDFIEAAANPQRVSESDTAPTWRHEGVPSEDGRYLCLVDMNTDTLHEQRCDWKDGEWYAYGSPMHDTFTVLAWWPLPKEAPRPEWWRGAEAEDE